MDTGSTERVAAGRLALLRAPVLTGAAGAAALTLLHVHDPHQEGSYGFCPFLAITGLPCPGCGGLRAVNHLTNGDWLAAVSSNAMAVVLVVAGGLAWVVWMVRRVRGSPVGYIPITATVPLVLLVAFLVFGVFRLTPAGAWFQP